MTPIEFSSPTPGLSHNNARNRELPAAAHGVLFISGYPGGELRHLGMRGEDAPFLQKPFTPHELAVNVRSLLDERLPRRRTA